MKINFSSKLFKSLIIHERFHPFKNRFSYMILSLYLDYSEITLLNKKLSIFSYNKFNIFSFYEKDHGYRDNRLLKEFVSDILNKNKISFKSLNIKILCIPRILGYAFNPLSVIFCFDKDNLISILYEVKNTANEQHTYCFANKSFSKKNHFKHKCNKVFYVSPFISMDAYYKFNTKIPSEKLLISIEQFNLENKKILFASQTGKLMTLSSKNLLFHLFYNPLLSIKVIFSIHFQALMIMLKGGKYYSRNIKKKDTVTFEGNL